MAKVEPRFLECRDCKFYSKKRVYPRCLRCGAGEYFEERQEEYEPSDEDLMQIYRKMDRDDE
jgi:hypothetical protein